MKIRIGNEIFDPNVTPVAIIFENDGDRKIVSCQIDNMPEKPGPRVYLIYDSDTLKDPMDFMLEAVKMSGYVG